MCPEDDNGTDSLSLDIGMILSKANECFETGLLNFKIALEMMDPQSGNAGHIKEELEMYVEKLISIYNQMEDVLAEICG